MSGPAALWAAARGLALAGALTLVSLAAAAETTAGQAPANDRKITPVPLEAGSLILRGEITYALFNGLIEALRRHPEASRLRLQSSGGLVPAARAIARQVERHGMAVEAEGLCASACVLIFLAGEPRRLAAGAELGFHTWHDSGAARLFGQPDPVKRDKAWMQSRGLEAGFVARAFATPHDSLWKPSRAELQAAGVLK